MDYPHTNTKKGFGWGYLILGILFVIVAVLSFATPLANLGAIAYAFAFIAILNGIWLIINRSQHTLRLVAGIIDIVIGLFIIFNISVAVIALPYVFAVWFIIDSLFRLFTVGVTRALGTGYFILSVILNILGIFVGIMLLFSPVLSASVLSLLVGFYLLMVGIECIALAFSTR